MVDLFVGLTVIYLCGAVAFMLVRSCSHRWPCWASELLSLVVLLAMFGYIRFVWHDPCLVALLPFSNLLVVGNWFPVAAGILGGLAWEPIQSTARRYVLVGGLAAAAGYSAARPLLGTPPHCMDAWQRDICLQSTSTTCTPACAATLLRAYGILATEGEMARLCLTRQGTSWLGLYRGLKLKTAGTPWDVEVLTCDALRLLEMREQPMILSVGWPARTDAEERMALAEWGLKRGVGHSVVMLPSKRPSSKRLRIADPAPGFGAEYWSVDDLQLLYRGIAMRLVKRP